MSKYLEIVNGWLAQTSCTRPERVHAAADETVRALLSSGRAAVALEPGDSTAYNLTVDLWPSEVARSWGGGRMVVSAPLWQLCWSLAPGGFHVPDYIAEKASARGGRIADGSAIVIAAFTTFVSLGLSDNAALLAF